MKIIAGGAGSGKTKKLMEIALEYLNDGKSVHIISSKNSAEEIVHRLRLESAKVGTSYIPEWNHKLIVAYADTLGKICKEIIDSNYDVILIDKTRKYKTTSASADMELITLIASKLNSVTYMTLNTKRELKEGVKVIDGKEIAEIAELM
ncbi:MAG: hypothetical protein APF76_12700 [Desulfitibacter sp. BRH_c19]|nr:MAG: hypothetical protein APF76_12700 [Desulfitibacter sp. BRH_c19]